MIEKLNRQVTSLEAVQKGEALPAPVPVAVPEPVVKIVEVKNCLYYHTDSLNNYVYYCLIAYL